MKGECEAQSKGEVLLLSPATVNVFAGVRGPSYCFLLPELAGPNSALREMMAIKFEDLRSPEEFKVTEAWKRFFLNEDAVVLFLQSVSPEEVKTVLAAGAAWRGTGWGTTRAAKAVWKLTGLAMVTTKFQEYLNSFLLSLSLSAGVEIPALELSDRASAVAFELSERWHARVCNQIPWQVPLEQELFKCPKKVSTGKKFSASYLLEGVPLYEGLKHKAEDHNDQSMNSQQDKILKDWQQRMLNVSRVLATLYPALKGAGASYDVTMQHLFSYILETKRLMLKERQGPSVPGAFVL